MSASTVQLAEQAAYTTIWSRDQWLEALSWMPARYELDEGKVAAVAKFAAATGRTPHAAVVALFPEEVDVFRLVHPA